MNIVLFLSMWFSVLQRSGELLEEAILSRTLNHLRGTGGHINNSCTTFIETLEYVHVVIRFLLIYNHVEPV